MDTHSRDKNPVVRNKMFFAVLAPVLTLTCNHIPAGTPPDFAFVFTSQSTDILTLDTFEGTCRRSTLPAGDSPAPFHLTESQLDSIYAWMRDIDFFSLPEYLEPELDVTAFPSPWFTYRVRTNGVITRVRFGGFITSGVEATKNLQRLSELIMRMIVNSPEYHALSALPPNPPGVHTNDHNSH